MARRGASGRADPATVPVVHRSGRWLAEAIRTRELTATEVVEAHIAVLRRTAWTNAVAAERFDAARAEAAAVDARVAAGEQELPPLLGVPATVKELIAVEGMPHSGGFPHRRRFRETADAPAVARLRAAGAIVLAVGNTPGPYYWLETNNKLYGRTRNPYDPDRTAGGSSGGDGAVVGAGGAPVALGSDMGGSIRIPAFCNGVFGHLPSVGLVPITGHFPMPSGDIRRTLFIGPLARRAEDLMPVLRAIAGPDGVDPLAGATALGEPDEVKLPGLRVVVSAETSLVPLRGVLRRRIEDAAAALAAAGADVEEVSLRGLRWGLAQFAAVAWSELDLLSSWTDLTAAAEPRPDGPGRPPLLVAAPARVLQLAEAAPLRAVRTRAARRLVDAARRASDDLAETLGGGALLHPPFPRVAPRHHTTAGQPWLASNTAVFNLFGMPATQVPLGIGDSGLPLGVQVAAAPGNDHVCIAVALELERAFGGWVDPERSGTVDENGAR